MCRRHLGRASRHRPQIPHPVVRLAASHGFLTTIDRQACRQTCEAARGRQQLERTGVCVLACRAICRGASRRKLGKPFCRAGAMGSRYAPRRSQGVHGRGEGSRRSRERSLLTHVSLSPPLPSCRYSPWQPSCLSCAPSVTSNCSASTCLASPATTSTGTCGIEGAS